MTAIRWRPAPRPDATPESRIVRLVGLLLLFESSLYSAVSPVLPHYAHELHASKPALGVLTAAYSAGLIPGSIIGGWNASRTGVRNTTVAGLAIFGVAVAAFGFGTNLVALDVLRVVQGASCGLIWGGGLTWAIAAAPRERRGGVIGSILAAASFGTLVGPLLGTLAVAAGTRPVFGAVGLISLALAVRTRLHPDPAPDTGAHRVADPAEPPPIAETLRSVLHSRGLVLGTWMITLEAMTIGAANVLLPLRLSHLGASGVAVGVTFLAAAALSTVLSPIIGRLTDRRGPALIAGVTLGIGIVLLLSLLLPRSAALLAVLGVVGIGGPLAGYMTPAVSMMTEAAERAGIALVVATTFMNLAYAAGETIGAPSAAAISQATSDAVPLLAVAALMLATLRPLLARQPSTGSSVTSRATSAA